MSRERTKQIAFDVAKKFAREGQLIAAGWAGYRMMVLPLDASQSQIDECRAAFMAGAQHVFGALVGILDSDDDENDAEMRRTAFVLIEKELQDAVREMQTRITGTKGSA